MIAPSRIRRRTAAARVGAVDHVIVNQSRAVKEFDDCGEFDRAGAAVPGVTRGEQQQRGAKALSSSAKEIAGDFGDRLESSRGLSRQFFFHKDEIVSDEIENLPGCEQRDGFPPCLHKPFSRNVVRCASAHSILCAYAAVNQLKVDSKPNYVACAVRRSARPPSRPPVRSCCSSSLKKRRKFAAVAAATSSAPKFLTDRNRLRYFGNIGRFVALAAIALRRKERRVRFDQNFLQRQSFRNVANVCRFRIG